MRRPWGIPRRAVRSRLRTEADDMRSLNIGVFLVVFGITGLTFYGARALVQASFHPSVAETCITVGGPGGVYVNLDDETNRETIDHERDAVRNGSARILHWDPVDAPVHRAASLRGVPTRPGFDRDEYPPAATQEGGAGADVRYISPADNRSAGSRMGAQMRAFCPGQAFILEP